ncbi:MAG: hypothetical protein ABI742_08805 [Gemmatimonadota bacterium]
MPPTSRPLRTPVHTLLGLSLLLAACPEPKPAVVSWTLEPTGDTVIAPYGDVTDGAWLEGARWVVIAPQDRAVSVVDFAKKSPSRFAMGQPKELEQPFHLFRAGDSIFIGDWLKRRLTSWSLAGAMGGALPAADALRGALPRGRDAEGRWYFELRPAPGPDGSGNRDSAAILRAANGSGKLDTVARLAPFDLVEVSSDGRRRLERRLLSGQDRWGVLPDGSLWIARVTQNRVDWRDPSGKVHEGDDLPDPVLPLTDNDREIFLSKFDAGLRPTVSQIPFAAIKPPFENALTAPDGLVWLVKNRAIGDTIRSYQVVNHAGQLVQSVTHRGLGHIIALGGGYALVGEPFAGGIRLLLFRVPAPVGPRGV